MVLPVVTIVSILEPTGGIELLLVDAYQIPQFLLTTTAEGNVIMSIPDNATDRLTAVSDGAIASGTTESLHDPRTNSNYQVTTTGQLRLVAKVLSGGTNVRFKVWSSTSADSATGTTEYDFTNTVSLDSGDLFTTPILEFSVTALDFINVEAIGANITSVSVWIIEIP